MSEAVVALDAPLHGLHLIEASAGTGKTWTLSGLYLRLVLERGLQPREILTLTFTKAATAELRERVRRRLQDMQDVLAGLAEGDALCQALRDRLGDAGLARRRLTAALRSLDDAAIHTIHGYCQRVLADRSFEAGTAFEAEIVQDTAPVLREIVLDFWRCQFAPGVHAPAFAAWLQASKLTPDELQSWLHRLVGKPGLEIRRGAARADGPALQARYDALRLRCADLWNRHRAELLRLLSEHEGLNRVSYRVANLPKYFDTLDAWFADPDAVELPERWPLFTSAHLREKSRNAPPAHFFFDAAEELARVGAALLGSYAQRWRELRLELLAHARSELPRRLRERGLQSYDDLLRNLHEALHGAGGEALAADLRARYPAALIDEFQDTDPLQWGILRRVYVEAGDEAGLAAFLVGDPKQAIYSFRGADVYTYLEAAACCPNQHALSENQRSVPGYVAALNALYGGVANPFRVARIASPPVRAAPREKPALIEAGERNPAPLRLVFCGADDKGKARARGDGEIWACDTTATEIARLLSSGASLGDHALQAGDIAVLVNSHYQASKLRTALARRGIACAVRSNDSVFASDEAEQLESLLLAVAHPQREALLRTALAGPLLGWTAFDLQSLPTDEARWDACLIRFARYHTLWREQGFMRMLRELLRTEQVYARLAATPDGERRLTNLLHLAELLQADLVAQQGIEMLLMRLAAGRRGVASEEAQLRLESDAGLVQLATIHGAKGLEYPVCFLPFLWNARTHVSADLCVHHDPDPPYRLVLDAGSDRAVQAARLARDEELAEALRLAYVALTRASHRCYLYSGCIKDLAASPLGLLLHGLVDADAETPEEASLRASLEALRARAPDAIRIEQPSVAGEIRSLPGAPLAAILARTLTQRPPPGFQVTSYTGLLHEAGPRALDELPDHDQRAITVPAAAPITAGGDRRGFPRGAAAGVCLHAILERIDWRAAAADWDVVIRAELLAAGFAAEWTAAVREWMHEVLRTPLIPPRAAGGRDTLSLSALDPARCIRELGFHLPLRGVSPVQVSALAQRYGHAVSALAPRRLDGYLRGFIDLVFEHQGRWYVADYKSNWLGGERHDYEPSRIDQAMAEGDYPLQYLLYTLALHRWLRTRLPDYTYERDCGGVFYLFLRGMAPDAQAADGSPLGVHAARPSAALIAALDALLAGEGLAA